MQYIYQSSTTRLLAYWAWSSCQPHYAINQSSATSLPSLIILPAPICNWSIQHCQLTEPDHFADPIMQLINQALAAYQAWSSCWPNYAINQSSTTSIPSLIILPAQLCNRSIKRYQLKEPGVEESNCPFLGFALPMSRFQIILLRVELYVMLKVM